MGEINGVKEPTERQYLILRVIRDNGEITIPDLARKTGISQRTLSRELDYLQKYHFLSRVEGRRYGHWVLTMPHLPKDNSQEE